MWVGEFVLTNHLTAVAVTPEGRLAISGCPLLTCACERDRVPVVDPLEDELLLAFLLQEMTVKERMAIRPIPVTRFFMLCDLLSAVRTGRSKRLGDLKKIS
jgi:hypothetical protein